MEEGASKKEILRKTLKKLKKKDVLEGGGHEVIEAVDGLDGVKKAEAHDHFASHSWHCMCCGHYKYFQA